MARCATVGCGNTATHKLVYTFQGERDQPITELVCAPCGQGYVRRPALQATLTPLRVKKSRQRMKLFVWHGVLTDYTSGMIVALAPTVDDAIMQVMTRQAAGEYFPGDLLADMRTVDPKEYEVTAGSQIVIEYVRGGG